MSKNPVKTEQLRNRNALVKSGSNPGSWTFKNHPEALLDLENTKDQRLQALAGEGYVPAASELRTTKRRQSSKDFWARSAYLADYQEAGEEIHKMPDDWTKEKKAGDSSSGFRRTTLRTYKGAGVELRMPSVTAVKEFAKAIGDQVLDIPVEMTDKQGATFQAWVRAVKTGNGEWETTTLGETSSKKASVMAAEAVAAVLEARRPTVALEEVGNLIDRYRRKQARKGTEIMGGSLSGGAYKNIAYDRQSKVLSMNYVGQVVGRVVPEEVAVQFLKSQNPVAMWNTTIRRAQNVLIRECGDCNRRYAAAAKHVCPVDLTKTTAGKLSEPRRKALRNFRESGVVKTLTGKTKAQAKA